MQSPTSAEVLARKVQFDPGYLKAFEAKVFIEGASTARKLTNYFVLLLLATVIATYGVLSDSTATVIGAMIVAPLMGPIMATAAAVVLGSSRRAARSLALVGAGVVSVILLSLFLTAIVPDVTISFTSNSELASRISPGLMALFTALAAGAAGAYITAREEIADSMGGVAIAISLVPPLCVVGVSINQGQWAEAGGAFMLFLTNFLAILFAGGIVFLTGGLGRATAEESGARVRRRAFMLIVVATMLIAIPLTATSYRAVKGALENRAATGDVRKWLQGTDNALLSTMVNARTVRVVVEGPGQLNPLQPLADDLAATLGRPVLVDLLVIPAQRQSSSSQAP